jgi:hypothetical protein
MNMIFHAIDQYWNGTIIFYDGPNVGIQFILILIFNENIIVFCMKMIWTNNFDKD